jgi:hypothetical protein
MGSPITPVHSQYDGFERRDTFTLVVMGAVSLALALLEQLGQPAPSPPEQPPTGELLQAVLR